MAFVLENFYLVGPAAGVSRQWRYDTADGDGALHTPGYFDDARWQLKAGDSIDVNYYASGAVQDQHRYLVVSTTTPVETLEISPNDITTQLAAERQAFFEGWTRVEVAYGGVGRQYLYKVPGGIKYGGIIILHGGGGSYTNFAIDEHTLTYPEYAFAQLALATGFMVLIPDSSYVVTDANDLEIGKVWDHEKLVRDNLDLTFLDYAIDRVVDLSGMGTDTNVFVVGHSSGGYMTVRLATNSAAKMRGMALMSSGDPYGTYRDGATHPENERENVKGVMRFLDNDMEITTPNGVGTYPGDNPANEKTWDVPSGNVKPPFKIFHTVMDGVNDLSAATWVRDALIDHSYPFSPTYLIPDDGVNPRSVYWHLWLTIYNQHLIDWFVYLNSFFSDFSEYTPPDITGWTENYLTAGWSWDTIASADAGVTGGTVMRVTAGAADALTVLSNDMYRIDGDLHDVEVLLRFKSRGVQTPTGNFIAGLMITGVPINGYLVGYPAGGVTLRMYELTAGTPATLDTQSITALLADTWYCVRFRRNKNGDLKAKHWAGAFADEPGTPSTAWTIETADATFTYGNSGAAAYLKTAPCDFDCIAMALDASAESS